MEALERQVGDQVAGVRDERGGAAGHVEWRHGPAEPLAERLALGQGHEGQVDVDRFPSG